MSASPITHREWSLAPSSGPHGHCGKARIEVHADIDPSFCSARQTGQAEGPIHSWNQPASL
jgi:hypothetical protein